MSAFDSAERKGHAAFFDGKKRTECPYRDYRTSRGCTTFARGFIRAWLRGWDKAKRVAK